MKSFKKWIGVEREPVQILNINWLHKDLSEKQILYLEQMISNYRNRNMAICRCDVQRVLDMCKGDERK